MKTLYLIFSKVRMIVRESPFVFVLLCIGIAACDLMFIYFYGAAQDFKLDISMPNYHFTHASGEKLSADELEARIYSVVPDAELNFYTTASTNLDAENTYPIRAKADAASFFKVVTGRADRLAAANTVLVPQQFLTSIYQRIMLGGKSLEVVGASGGTDFIMTKDTFVQNGFVPEYASARVIDFGASLDAFKAAVGNGYTVEYTFNPAHEGYAAELSCQALVLYAVCAITFLFLCTYIYEDSAYELGVYQMLGASRMKIIVILCGAMFVILSAVSVITQAIHALLYVPVFSHLFTTGLYVYTLADYAKIYLLSVGITEAFVILYITVKTRRSAIRNVRKAIR